MKSTLKIALDSQGNLSKSVIKIVQPVEVLQPTEYDEHIGNDDDRDRQIRDLLQSPMNPWLNDWFEVNTRFPIPIDDNKPTTHYITTIAAVEQDDLFRRFKNSILNRVIPFEDMVKINRNDVPSIESEKLLLEGKRPSDRFDESLDKYRQINAFFNWLIDDVEICSGEEQQPTSPDGRPRN